MFPFKYAPPPWIKRLASPLLEQSPDSDKIVTIQIPFSSLRLGISNEGRSAVASVVLILVILLDVLILLSISAKPNLVPAARYVFFASFSPWARTVAS